MRSSDPPLDLGKSRLDDASESCLGFDLKDSRELFVVPKPALVQQMSIVGPKPVHEILGTRKTGSDFQPTRFAEKNATPFGRANVSSDMHVLSYALPLLSSWRWQGGATSGYTFKFLILPSCS